MSLLRIPEKAVFEVDDIQMVVKHFVYVSLKHVLQSPIRSPHVILVFEIDQGNHRVCDQPSIALNGIPPSYLANEYRSFRSYGRNFFAQAVLGYYVIRNGAEGILLLGGGSHLFHP